MSQLPRFVLRRLALMLITLFVVSLLVFVLSHVLPGDLGRAILGPYASNVQVAALDHRLGYDRPLLVQYGSWISGFLRGRWGYSFVQGTAVAPLVLARLWASIQIGIVAIVVIIPVSIVVGVAMGLREGGLLDQVASVAGLSLIAIPEFVSGIILLVVFGVGLGWFPVTASSPAGAGVIVRVHHLLLPAIPLMFVLFGYIARMARAGTIEVVGSAYYRTAVLKGLPRWRIITRHVLRNALPPTITVTAVQAAGLVSGLVVIETLFNYPGIGQLLLNSAVDHDVPVLEAATFLIGLIIMVANLLADISYAFLDPRVRLAQA
jgi:peptide/nickel transport system permease protein